MPKLKINQSDLETAFELGTNDATAYLDSEKGAVLIIEETTVAWIEDLVTDQETLDDVHEMLMDNPELSPTDRAQLLEAAQVDWDTVHRYRQIPQQDSHAGYGDMADFIASLEDDRAREVLAVAIQGSGAFRRFKDALARNPDLEASWYTFRDARTLERLLEWLEEEEISADLV